MQQGMQQGSTIEDGLGDYVVLNKAVVSRDTVFRGDEDVVAKVPVGTVVKVLEVEHCAEERRIRGRLEHPAGWMSLLNTETGRRWAAKLILCPQGHVLHRRHAEEKGRCNLCERVFAWDTKFLCCQSCQHSMCSQCIRLRAPLQTWAFNVTAGVNVNRLGLSFTVMSSMRVMIQSVEAGSWAEAVGVQAGDELTAVNGVSVEKVTSQELDSVLQNSRPLEFMFAYNGAEISASDSNASSEQEGSLLVTLTLQGVDLTALLADAKLLADFKAIVRHTVASEAGGAVLPEAVELTFNGEEDGSNLLRVRCVLPQLPETSADVAHSKLSRSIALGRTVAAGLSKLDRIRSVCTCGTISVTQVEVGASMTHAMRGHLWPHHWGIAKGFLKRFHKPRTPLKASKGSPKLLEC